MHFIDLINVPRHVLIKCIVLLPCIIVTLPILASLPTIVSKQSYIVQTKNFRTCAHHLALVSFDHLQVPSIVPILVVCESLHEGLLNNQHKTYARMRAQIQKLFQLDIAHDLFWSFAVAFHCAYVSYLWKPHGKQL